MTDTVECAVIGAGVVGLAIARELAQAGVETIVLESERRIGTGTSSRNSEVIHAGIYYPQDSLKAGLCVAGKTLLYDYCADRRIDHKRCGKLIVATDEAQAPVLDEIVLAARRNGVVDLEKLTRAEVLALEPGLHCVAALRSPSTGIIDSHALMLGFQGDFENAGGIVACEARVLGGEVRPGGIRLHVGGSRHTTLEARYVVNSTGLGAQSVANSIAGIRPASIPALHYAKGSYFTLKGRSPFRQLVYPVPEPGGLGVHLTLDLGGRARFGPDVEWVDSINYSVDPQRAGRYYESIRRYWPALADDSLSPAYAGIRPKLAGPGEPGADFVIQGADDHAVQGLVNLYGIESPGLTASLAIARLVWQRLLEPELSTIGLDPTDFAAP